MLCVWRGAGKAEDAKLQDAGISMGAAPRGGYMSLKLF
jgi:hypothetical protein